MPTKILTVDDSKTVRIIVRKAFKPYDCEILEASNGVEGLAVAAKESPQIILLDVTMPVMDGVEMLTKLKSDPALKSIPVMMLTAEGGRDNVLKIAKIGVRDYIVKPFKEEVLVEKAGRIVELKSLADAAAKAPRTIFDPATILVVEDKPAIVQQVQDGLKHTPWKVQGVGSQAEALDFCNRGTPDLIVVSLSLADEAAFALFRALRNNAKTKYTPVFGLCVKTETAAQQQAQTMGFTAVITKPIDMGELEARIAKAMNLDTSQRYFSPQADHLVIRLPENCNSHVVAEVTTYMKPKLAAAVDSGHNKVLVDAHALKALDMGVMKLLVQAMQTCRDLGMHFVVVGNAQLAADCKGFEDTRTWTIYESVEEARAALQKPQPVGV